MRVAVTPASPCYVLDRLLRDPDPSVLSILLKNPRITEADVVRLAARRPTSAAAQQAIFRCERFVQRYAVKRALVLNPHTPSDVAARLVVLLARPDLLAVARDGALGEPVRAAARTQLRTLSPQDGKRGNGPHVQ